METYKIQIIETIIALASFYCKKDSNTFRSTNY